MTDPKTIYLQPECCADPEVGRLWCEDDAPETCEDGVPWTKYVLASERAKQAEPVAWMVGNDPMTAATYNAGDKEKAFDAAKRWNWPITGLSVIAGAPDFDINYQQTKPVGEWRMKNGEPMHVLWRARYKPQLGDKLYAAPPAVQGEPVERTTTALRCERCGSEQKIITYGARVPIAAPPADQEKRDRVK